MSSAWLAFSLAAAFIGIYLNVWFFLQLMERRKVLLQGVPATRFPAVSIIVPAHNEAATIGATLDSFLALDYPIDRLEALVVSNGSTDRTADVARSYAARTQRIRVLEMPRPGKSEALNVGMEAAQGTLIGVLDADTWTEPDCLKRLIGYFDDPKVAAVTTFTKVANPRGLLGRLQSIEYLFGAVSKRLIGYLDGLYITPGTLSILRKDLVLDAGGFQSDTLTEDMDMPLTLYARGWRVVNTMDAVTWTHAPRTLHELFRQRLRWYRGFLQNCLKHNDLFFVRRWSHLAHFIIPSSLLAVTIGIILTVNLVWVFGKQALVQVQTLLVLPLTDQLAVAAGWTPDLKMVLLAPYNLVLFGSIFVSSLLVLSWALRMLGLTGKRNWLLLVPYMLLYYCLIMFFWLAAGLAELFRSDKKW